ncbi:glycoside hydrolase family 127 protein [Paenibacillus anaericanus]|uniref:Glycoside hydrolase family 127 protein n=2 Tax=Paenibacillus anaericanus TaxID=170367 RepID=A0A433Y7D2_9BACL|nr:glycoside hydrolase family 127 protein [Paenibacillus anaericanus]
MMTQLNQRVLAIPKSLIHDPFWSEYIRLVRKVVVPYQWEALNDRVPEAEPSHAITNFKIAAGEAQGEFYGMVFQDSDVAKWLEAVAYLLETQSDPDLEQIADEVIEIIAKAQQPDGYLNTYFTLKEPGNRWTNLAECHELYCAGHMIEAGVAYYQATGKRVLLDVVCRFADYIDTVFGNEPGQLQGYDGHQEIELALMKLYHATGEDKYLRLSSYFLEQRGAKPDFYEDQWEKRGKTTHFPQLTMTFDHAYSQAHLPVREQDTAEGHAVRLVYMCTAMADLAAETGDPGLLEACRKLWSNIVNKRMYITGGIGSMEHGESFTMDYDLPGDTAYAETCASIGLIFFAQRMLRISPDSKVADVMERALYNTVVSGMSQDGKKFFYVNPLEVYPAAHGKNRIYDHVKPERQGWFGCACCPPNIARLLASLGDYVYTMQDGTVYVQLYIGSELNTEVNGKLIKLEQHSKYTSDGEVNFRIRTEEALRFTLALRMPDWCDRVEVTVGGEWHEFKQGDQDGYIRLNRVWEPGEEINVVFSMPVLRMKAHPLVRQTFGKVALQRGPFVYCLEEADNGAELYQLKLPRNSTFEVKRDDRIHEGLNVIHVNGERWMAAENWQEHLYRSDSNWIMESTQLKFIPYFTWANRGLGEMSVWVEEALPI